MSNESQSCFGSKLGRRVWAMENNTFFKTCKTQMAQRRNCVWSKEIVINETAWATYTKDIISCYLPNTYTHNGCFVDRHVERKRCTHHETRVGRENDGDLKSEHNSTEQGRKCPDMHWSRSWCLDFSLSALSPSLLYSLSLSLFAWTIKKNKEICRC